VLALAGISAGMLAATAWAADSVSLSTTATAVKYDEPFFLSGVVPSSRGGERVTIERDDCGPVPWHPVDAANTVLDGVWRIRGDAEANSRFRARWGEAISQPVTVSLRPELALTRTKSGRLKVNVTAYKPFAGRLIVLQQTKARGWVTIGRARLARAGGFRVYTSSAVFRAKVRRGATLRAVLSAQQASMLCYAAGYSPAFRVP
jgi:hypothetical protein